MGFDGRSDDGEGLGPFQDRGALPTRSHARGAVRPVQIHVSPARPGRVQVDSGTDPKLRHLPRVHSSRNDRRLTFGLAHATALGGPGQILLQKPEHVIGTSFA